MIIIKKGIDKTSFIRNLLILACICVSSIYLINRERKINNMKEELKEVVEMNKSLKDLNEDLETEIKTIQDIIEELNKE